MATPVLCCGFECGVSNAHFNLNGAAASFSTTAPRSGTRHGRINASAAQASLRTLLSGTVAVGRVYWHASTQPSASRWVVLWRTSGAVDMGVWYDQASASLVTRAAGVNGGSGFAVSTGQWYRIDFKFDISSNPWTIDAQIDGTALGQATNAVAGATGSLLDLGDAVTGNNTLTWDFDDYILSTTAGDYPLRAGFVHHFVPTADGTHNVAGANDFERSGTGTDITNATTDAYQLIDDVPLDSGAGTDYINMIAPPNATDYTEHIFGPAPAIPTPVTAPRAVEVVASIHQNATTTGNMELRLNDNGTMGTIYSATGVAGVTTIAYKRAHFADPPSAASKWVIGGGGNGDFTDLRVRFGSPAALDVVPDQFLDSIMIEAEFATLASAGAQPASTGTIAKKYLIALSGSQPASTGAIEGQHLSRTAQGDQPAPSGTLAKKYLIALSGSQPAATGTVVGAPVGPTEVGLSGNQPAATGTIAKKYLIALSGAQPAATGALDGQLIATAAVAGNQPAATGAIAKKYLISLAGSQPAATGRLELDASIRLAGSQPAATGAVDGQAITSAAVSGNQPNATGAIAAKKYLVALAGNQPSATGRLELDASIRLAGAQPAASGTIQASQLQVVNLAGNQPAAAGAFAVDFFILLAGAQPAASGRLRLSAQIRLSGNQPNATGAIDDSQGIEITLSGNQPSATGRAFVAYQSIITLRGSQSSGFSLAGSKIR